MLRQLTALALGLSCVAVVFANQNPVPPSGQATRPAVVLKPGSTTIVGKVVEAGTNTGVATAVVTLIGPPQLGASIDMFANGVQGGNRRVAVDAQGQFVFRDLPAGAYRVTASAAGYADGDYGQTQPRLMVYRLVELTDADKLVTIEVPMWRKGGISGRAIDETGEPMVGAPIAVLARTPEWTGLSLQSAARVTTDDRGMYHADVDPGDYIVGLMAATTTVPVSAVGGFLQAQAEGGAAFQGYMAQITTSGSLLPRGVGSRVGNFMVSQLSMLNVPAVPPFTMRDGRLTFYPTTFHPSSTNGSGAAVVVVGSGEEKTGIDLQVRPVPARRVSGRVVGPDGPVTGIALRLLASDSTAAGSGTWNVSNDTSQTVTDGAGDFTFLGIGPGAYTMRVLRSNTPSDPVLWAAEQISVNAEADLTDLTIRLQAGAPISGRVVIEGNGPPPSPAALRAIGIRPTPMPGSPSSLMGPVGWIVRPDDNRRFTTGQMVPGPYLIAVSTVPLGWMLKSVTVGGQSATDKPVDLTAAGITDVVVTITDKLSTLTGTARDGNGQAAPQATVVVFPVDKSLWISPGLISNRIRTIAPLRDGRYSFPGLPAGEYFVAAVDSPTTDFSESKALARFIPAASRVVIGDGESKVQDLRVEVIR